MSQGKKVKVYKGTERDMRCYDFQYELGKEYSMPADDVKMCNSGFHACYDMYDVFTWYPQGRLFEAEGIVEDERSGKVVCSTIKLVREINRHDLFMKVFRENTLHDVQKKIKMNIEVFMALPDVPEQALAWGLFLGLSTKLKREVARCAKSRHMQVYIIKHSSREILEELAKNPYLYKNVLSMWPKEHRLLLLPREDITYRTKRKWLKELSSILRPGHVVIAMADMKGVPVAHLNNLDVNWGTYDRIGLVLKRAKNAGLYPSKLIWKAYKADFTSLKLPSVKMMQEDLLENAWNDAGSAERLYLLKHNETIHKLIVERSFHDICRPR